MDKSRDSQKRKNRRCVDCGAIIVRFFGRRLFCTIVIVGSVLVAAGMITWFAIPAIGSYPSAPAFKTFPSTLHLALTEPLPDNWKEFLPPGVELLSKDRRLYTLDSDYGLAIETAKKEAREAAAAKAKAAYDEAKAACQKGQRKCSERRNAAAWSTIIIAIMAIIAAWLVWRTSGIVPVFCWRCGARLGERVAEEESAAKEGNVLDDNG